MNHETRRFSAKAKRRYAWSQAKAAMPDPWALALGILMGVLVVIARHILY